MPIRIDCPRCKQSLSVPSRMAGSYANCPRCKGRFWVPQEKAKESVPLGAAGDAARSVAGPGRTPAPPPADPQTVAEPRGRDGGSTRPSGTAEPPPETPVPPPPPPKRAKKVARFITAEAAKSTLKVAEDGKLPELRLEDVANVQAKQEKGASLNPLVMLGLICMSLVLSVVLLFVDLEPQGPSNAEQRAHARHVIEEEFFADLNSPEPRKAYQIYLREAQRAHSRGDVATERRLYCKVLDLLRAERGRFEGLTGSPGRDKKLEEQISTLLSEE